MSRLGLTPEQVKLAAHPHGRAKASPWPAPRVRGRGDMNEDPAYRGAADVRAGTALARRAPPPAQVRFAPSCRVPLARSAPTRQWTFTFASCRTCRPAMGWLVVTRTVAWRAIVVHISGASGRVPDIVATSIVVEVSSTTTLEP